MTNQGLPVGVVKLTSVGEHRMPRYANRTSDSA